MSEELTPINMGNFLYLDPSGEMRFSLVFDAWIFDYLIMTPD